MATFCVIGLEIELDYCNSSLHRYLGSTAHLSTSNMCPRKPNRFESSTFSTV